MGHSPRVRALAARLREVVCRTVPEAIEKAYPGWHGIGFRYPSCGYICGIYPQQESMRLLSEFGALISDPDCLSKWKGKAGPLCGNPATEGFPSATNQAIDRKCSPVPKWARAVARDCCPASSLQWRTVRPEDARYVTATGICSPCTFVYTRWAKLPSTGAGWPIRMLSSR